MRLELNKEIANKSDVVSKSSSSLEDQKSVQTRLWSLDTSFWVKSEDQIMLHDQIMATVYPDVCISHQWTQAMTFFKAITVVMKILNWTWGSCYCSVRPDCTFN
ncbi:hypothetical protein KXD40_005735 [Peronospora effusa]|uniref:Uncharacterized protein n=1 Tax=Peronospora effusa TaxID=542832 RepID=A0A3M6VMV1_9STRA|nr:hypothetical protein DD238_006730 [Peronospora effusa]RQM15261.1 hypothetical protein DD237_002967 [Peronospora effusa]UIZ27756.1 hypothetical protein KXD40_005735 [Peronospora effusa]